MTDNRKPLCKHCRNFNGNLKFPRCTAIKHQNLVNGQHTPADCYPQREVGAKCGPEGKLFAAVKP